MDNLSSKVIRDEGLTKDQEEGMSRLLNFVNGSKTTYTLCGYAGTGKTFLLNYFLNSYNRSVVVTAPTHKAVRMIEQLTGRRGKTLHSLLGLRPNLNLENFNINNVKFDLLGSPQISHYNLVIIDECSQINSGLKMMIEQIAANVQNGIKILYIGDICQLPPIGERVSETFKIKDKFELTEIVRQEEGNPLVKVLAILRDDIINNKDNFIKYIGAHKEEVTEKGGYILLNRDAFKLKLIEYFTDKAFENNINYARYTGRTNENIREWNKFIRDKTIKDATTGMVCIDDLFTGYKTIVDEFISPIIINSEDYIVNQIEERISQDGFKGYNLVLTDVFTGMLTPTITLVDHTHPTFINYIRKVSNLHDSSKMERGRRWKEYYEFKNRFLILHEFPIRKNGIEQAKITRDLDYGYGLTTYKIQGSTYDNIFINLVNMIHYNYEGRKVIIKDNNYCNYAVELRNKSLYVALSRAKKLAILYL